MSDFLAVPLILDRKAPGHVQIVVGDLRCQIDFVAAVIGGGGPVHEIQVARLEDAPVLEALQGKVPTLFVLAKPVGLSLAQDTRAKVGVWSAELLKPRGAGIKVLVRQGMALVGVKELADERILVIGDTILNTLGGDALPQALIWEAAWHLTDPGAGAAPADRVHPWEDAVDWAKGDVPLGLRLHWLYQDLCGYVFGLDNDWKCATALGLSPSKFAWLKTLRLNLDQVEAALLVLSRWRGRTWNDSDQALRVALQINRIFAK
jgi:hypothetical protein